MALCSSLKFTHLSGLSQPKAGRCSSAHLEHVGEVRLHHFLVWPRRLQFIHLIGLGINRSISSWYQSVILLTCGISGLLKVMMCLYGCLQTCDRSLISCVWLRETWWFNSFKIVIEEKFSKDWIEDWSHLKEAYASYRLKMDRGFHIVC